jgi:hypothetical protein
MELGWAHTFFMLCHNDGDNWILSWGILVFILKRIQCSAHCTCAHAVITV